MATLSVQKVTDILALGSCHEDLEASLEQELQDARQQTWHFCCSRGNQQLRMQLRDMAHRKQELMAVSAGFSRAQRHGGWKADVCCELDAPCPEFDDAAKVGWSPHVMSSVVFCARCVPNRNLA